MKYLILSGIASLLVSLVLSACQGQNPNTNSSAGGVNPNNPVITFGGKPADFSGSWNGKGMLYEDLGKKTQYLFNIVIKQNVDANGTPKDIEATIAIGDSAGDIVYGASLKGFSIVERALDKTKTIYEIVETTTNKKFGEIGADGFSLHHQIGKTRVLNIDVNGTTKEMRFAGYKMVGNKKTNFSAVLKK